MSRQNTLVGEVTIRKSGFHNKSIKGATGFTMPTKPQQAYSCMKQQLDRQISDEIMFIPFPEIRNVIVTFMKPYPLLEKDESQILAAQYKDNRQLKKIDQQITQKISTAYHQRTKLQRVLKCFQKAQNLKQTVNDLKQKVRKFHSSDLSDLISQIQQQAERAKSRSKSAEQQQQIQQEKNNSIIQQLMEHEKLYCELNEHFINLDSTLAQISEFSKEMQKIVPIVWRLECLPESSQQIPVKNFIEYFETTIRNLFQPLAAFIHSSETWLQLYRNKVKSRSWDTQTNPEQIQQYQSRLQQFLSSYNSIEQEIKIKVYQKLHQISKLDQHIVPNLSAQINSNLNNYEDFVETYTDIKEIANTKNQWDQFERIISDEERYLSDHMKYILHTFFRINCGLGVYYKSTRMFEEFANAIDKRTYVRQIFNQRLTPIRGAIKYINEQYSDMYKRACEDNYSRSKLRKNEVKKMLLLFQKDLQTLQSIQSYKNNQDRNINIHYEFIIHLIQSLNRLMALASE